VEQERLDAYLEKSLREGKLRSGWLDPDEAYEAAVQEFSRSVRGRTEVFARRLAATGNEVALDQTLLKVTCPGVPDIYQGDEAWSVSLVDPDNRRPVPWDALRGSLDQRDHPKQELVRAVLAERVEGDYEPVDAGPDVCAFTRGGRHLVAVPVRPGASYEPGAGWRKVTRGLWAAAPRTGR
jgi:(1->4)-alpha-D-glucan 1-alpha-D-glucosylmutase